MAAPVTHILLALQILPSMPDKNPKDFIVGTSFPDIRYLEVIKREQTHFKNVTLEQIANEPNSFKAGMMFHALVDEVREDYMKERGVDALVEKSMFSSPALKFNEDMILYGQLQDVDALVAYFDDVLPEQRQFKIKDIYLQTWNKSIARYLTNPVPTEGRFKFLKRTSKKRFRIFKDGWFVGAKKSVLYTANKILFDKLEAMVQEMRTNKELEAIVWDFYNNFRELAKKKKAQQ